MSKCICMHNALAFDCFALETKALQSFDVQRIKFLSTFTWVNPHGQLVVGGPNTQKFLSDTLTISGN